MCASARCKRSRTLSEEPAPTLSDFICHALRCNEEALSMRQGCCDDGTRTMRVALIIVTLSGGWPAVSIAQQAAAPQCQASGALVRIPELPEASGVAVSRRSPGRLSVYLTGEGGG